jgi:hypothetical protein
LATTGLYAADLRLGIGNGNLAAGRDHVEFAGNEHREAARMTNATGDATRVITGAPVGRRAPVRPPPIPCPAQSSAV